mgnify:CR=1 FL=1
MESVRSVEENNEVEHLSKELLMFHSSNYIFENKKMEKLTNNLFFNKEEPDMINVAVTRAKEIFILFGNKEVLKDEEK